MDKEDYAAKFRDPRWQQMRLRVLERDEWTCQMCATKETELQVHHRWYGTWGRDPWGYPLHALVTLCVDCHEYETVSLKDSTADLIQILKQAGASSTEFTGLCQLFATPEPVTKRQWNVAIWAFNQILRDKEWAKRAREGYAQFVAEYEARKSSPT